MFNVAFHVTYKASDQRWLPPALQEDGAEHITAKVHTVPCLGSTIHVYFRGREWEWKVADVHYLMGNLTSVNQPINASPVANIHVISEST